MECRSQTMWSTTKVPELSSSNPAYDDGPLRFALLAGHLSEPVQQRALLGELDNAVDSVTATPRTELSIPTFETPEIDLQCASSHSKKGQKRKSIWATQSCRSKWSSQPKVSRTSLAACQESSAHARVTALPFSIKCTCNEAAPGSFAIGCCDKCLVPRFCAPPNETPQKLRPTASSPPKHGRRTERISRIVLSNQSPSSPSSRTPRSYAIEAIEKYRSSAKPGRHLNGDQVHEFFVKWEGYEERSWVKADCFERYGDMFRAACKRFGVCLLPSTALCKSAVARHVDLNLHSLASADDKSFASQLQVCCS
jgi:hypothetical protein